MTSTSIEPEQLLANAVIKKAVEDYRTAVKSIKKGRGATDAEHTKAECMQFFRSEWFKVLTKIDPEYLIAELLKEEQG